MSNGSKMKTDTESKRCKSCTHQGEKAMTGKCFTCYDYENYEGSGDNDLNDYPILGSHSTQRTKEI